MARGLICMASFLGSDTETRRGTKSDSGMLYNQSNFIAEGLRNSTDSDIETDLVDMTAEEDRRAVGPAFSAESDSGPEDVWRWSHADESPVGWRVDRGFVLSETQTSLRECGYLFWDRSRTGRWGLLQQPWEGEFDTALKRTEREGSSRKRFQDMAESMDKRRVPPPPQAARPESLSEAIALWSSWR